MHDFLFILNMYHNCLSATNLLGELNFSLTKCYVYNTKYVQITTDV